MSNMLQSQVLAYLAFLTGPLVDTIIPLTQPVVTLGRASTNDIVIADPKVSRLHARLTLRNGSWHIENLSQTSSVSVDQQRIDQVTLASHSQVNLGSAVSFRFLLSLEQGVLMNQSGEQDNIAHEVGDTTHLRTERSSTPKPTAPESSLEYVPSIPMAVGKTTEVGKPSDMGIASLEVLNHSTGARKEYALLQTVVSVGQDTANDIVLPEQSVSDFHLQIRQQDGQWTILHPHPQRGETRNGLLFAGRKIKGKEEFRHVLKSGDTFRIANESGTLVTLTFRDGQKHKQEFLPRMEIVPLEQEAIRIGRSQENTLVLNHPQVSAHHALLRKEQDAWRLIDLNSTNHTYVNGLPVTNHLLTADDEIRIGAFKIIYHASQLAVYDESGGIRIDVLNLGQVRHRHLLLHDISLSIPQCSFVALVGASGAGKSTLLNAISGLQPASEGAVFYNGQNYYEHLAAFKTQIGYVPQDEIIHRDLSVERALYYAARLRLPRDFTHTQIEQRINEVLDDVEMQHRRTHLVRHLSGGQRKRVSIALELLANPSIFFLDEPTSGLDPGLDRKMMVLLRKLADKGHTIVLVTHATNNIHICDYVCFLAPGGHLAYFGPPEKAKTYFRQADFAEIYGMLEPGPQSSDISLDVAEQFRQSEEYQIYIDKPLNHRPQQNTQLLRQSQKQRRMAGRGTSWRQFLLLCLRLLELLKNDRVNLAILLLQAPIIGLLLLIFIKGVGPDGFNPNNVLHCPATSAIIASAGFPDVPTPLNPIVSTSCQRVEHFLQSDPSGIAYARQRGSVLAALQDFLVPGPDFSPTVLFIMAFSAVLFGCINSAREFVKEAPIYRRERAVNLGIIPYMFSKIVVLGSFCLFQSLILVGCVAVFDPFHRGTFLPPFLEAYIPIALTSLVALMIGLAISALVSNNDRAMSFVPLVLIPQVLFSGVIFPLSSWFLQYLGLFFPIRWSMAALGSSIGLHSDKLNGDQLIAGVNTYQSTLFSTTSSQDATHYLLLMWLALVAMIFLLGIAIGIFLKRKDTHQSH